VSQGLDNLRIVIVDSQKHARSALTGFLSGLGSIVRERANADDVMTPRFQPDLVLSDIAMPDKDGIELLREIGSLGPSEGGKVALIVITGLS
jgi:CheY-like chemotaxis protein